MFVGWKERKAHQMKIIQLQNIQNLTHHNPSPLYPHTNTLLCMFAISVNGNLTNPTTQTWNLGIILDPSLSQYPNL